MFDQELRIEREETSYRRAAENWLDFEVPPEDNDCFQEYLDMVGDVIETIAKKYKLQKEKIDSLLYEDISRESSKSLRVQLWQLFWIQITNNDTDIKASENKLIDLFKKY